MWRSGLRFLAIPGVGSKQQLGQGAEIVTGTGRLREAPGRDPLRGSRPVLPFRTIPFCLWEEVD